MKSFASVISIVAIALGLAACGQKKQPQAPKPTAERMNVAPEPTGGEQPLPPLPETQGEETTEQAVALQEVIHFAFDSSELSPEARSQLEQNYQWLQQHPNKKLRIEGHTDPLGTPEYNLALGERRAQSARDYLVHLGADANRLYIVTYGEERLISQDDAQNRRDMFIPEDM